MRRSTLGRVILVCIVVSISACSANHHSIFRHKKIGGSSITMIDAKQRAILSGEITTDGPRRFCSEPSPDMFTVIAQAFSGGGTFGSSADPKMLELALNTAFSTSEQGATIPRTQTINMLRELMFRTCERHMNGGIGELELPLQAIRDQRLMVSILAIEQLTGAIAPKPLVIGVHGNAESGASGALAAVRLDDLYTDLQAKAAAQQKFQKEFDEINSDSKDCDSITAAIAKGEESKLTEVLKGKKGKCESSASTLAKAKGEYAEATKHYAEISNVAASGSIPTSARASLMDPKASGGIDRAHSDAITGVAAAVQDIVKRNFDQDEFLFLCLKVLSKATNKDQQVINDAMKNTCIEYTKTSVALQGALNEKLIQQESVRRQGAVKQMFDIFWKKIVGSDGKVDAGKFDLLKQKILGLPVCFAVGGTKESYEYCFGGAGAQMHRDLADVEL